LKFGLGQTKIEKMAFQVRIIGYNVIASVH